MISGSRRSTKPAFRLSPRFNDVICQRPGFFQTLTTLAVVSIVRSRVDFNHCVRGTLLHECATGFALTGSPGDVARASLEATGGWICLVPDGPFRCGSCC